MIRNLLRFLTVAAALSSALAFSAEPVKLRHIVSLYSDEKGNMFKAPLGAACSDNSLIVADTGNGRLISYVHENGIITFKGEYQVPELLRPSKLQINSKGDIFAFDEKMRRIVHLSPGGAFIGYVEPTGLPAPGLSFVRSFKIDERDNIYLLDIRSERVLVLDQVGKFQREIKFPPTYGFFSDLAVNPGGTVLLLDTTQCSIFSAGPAAQAFTPLTEKLKEYMIFPTHITVDSGGIIYITDQNGGSVVMLTPAGAVLGKQLATGWKEGLLRYPSQACVANAGDFFIADRENNRIQVFTIVR